MARARILVVDDDRNIVQVVRARLQSQDFDVEVAYSGPEALKRWRGNHYDVMITDVKMPDMSGLELMKRVQALNGNVQTIMLTAYGTIDGAVSAMKDGAFDYLTKPFDSRELLFRVERALEKTRLATEVKELRQRIAGEYSLNSLCAKSPKMKTLVSMLERIIRSDSTVLIEGESGTGKELAAKIIHYEGRRRDEKFVTVDCGATPQSLLESELFGHVKGAFTSANSTKKGLFEVAHQGTIFLDEISNISSEMQTRLLRVLEEQEIKPVGDVRVKKVDCRVIGATNRNLREMVGQGKFREDLFYRLSVLNILMPPLRERREDIPLLANQFLREFSKKMGKSVVAIDRDVMAMFLDYHWPGNVRELRNVIEAAVVMAREDHLTHTDLILTDFRRPLEMKPQDAGPSQETVLKEHERRLVVEALKKCNWVQKDAAQMLGISGRVINYKIKKFGISIPKRRRAV
ncbi:MAG: sigma-54-dependent Fis family transcriptional regulator [Deltaproteobacteria bacterium]|nr:sigma-54-dependent Fis family transcriptional regulator [Deltaproteobacteria bacterium]MBW2121067.1 sigma-54-dependent Fis family transcriptional regulator [Deltaproteobacteria bacterium]